MQDDLVNQGYQRVEAGEGTLSTSATATSLDTVVIDTDAENLIALEPTSVSARLTSDVSKLRNTGVEPNRTQSPTAEQYKKSAPTKSSLKDTKVSHAVSFEDFEDEAADKIDDDFLSQRAHFQKNKSSSSATKRLLLNVSVN